MHRSLTVENVGKSLVVTNKKCILKLKVKMYTYLSKADKFCLAEVYTFDLNLKKTLSSNDCVHTSGGPWPVGRVCATDFLADFCAFARKFMQSCRFLADFCWFSRKSTKISENQREKVTRAHPNERLRTATGSNSATLASNWWTPYLATWSQIDFFLETI